MRKYLQRGGYAASAIVIVIGVASVAAGLVGRNDVRDKLSQENIVGTPDMGSIANKKIDTGSEAKTFAEYMRGHALEATGGKTYAELDRFIANDGGTTSDETQAATDSKGVPIENPIREVWVTETALSTALNTSYFAERVATFSIGVGLALILAGIGFFVFLLVPPRR